MIFICLDGRPAERDQLLPHLQKTRCGFTGTPPLDRVPQRISSTIFGPKAKPTAWALQRKRAGRQPRADATLQRRQARHHSSNLGSRTNGRGPRAAPPFDPGVPLGQAWPQATNSTVSFRCPQLRQAWPGRPVALRGHLIRPGRS